MRISKARDLRLMSHAQHLVTLGELLEFQTDRFAHAAPNAAVDFVKDNRAWKLRSSGDGLQHKHKPRGFAARCHFRQGLHRLADIRGKVELDAIDTGSRE